MSCAPFDYEALGLIIGLNRDLRATEAFATREIEAAEAMLSQERSEAAARQAGMAAEIRALHDALRQADPKHPALRPTGLHYPHGPQLSYERAWHVAYDRVADANGIPRSGQPKSRAQAAYDSVMAEEIVVKRGWFHVRTWWRGVEHRYEDGAIRARKRAAEAAYAEAEAEAA